jgi:hypothetical protein
MEKMNKCKNVGYVKACYEICPHSDQHDMIRECNCGCSVCIPIEHEVEVDSFGFESTRLPDKWFYQYAILSDLEELAFIKSLGGSVK